MKEESQPNRLDRAIAKLAERQHGLVARRQLVALGASNGAVANRIAAGRLHQIHRGVYAAGHRVMSADAWRMAAVLLAGDGAVLSHRSAAELWRIRGGSRDRTEMTVAVRRAQVRAVQCHFAPLPEDEVTTVRGIRVTIVPRTLLDLAAVLPRVDVEAALKQADVLRLTDRLSLPDLVARYPLHRGAKTARAILAARTPAGVPRNVFEIAFLEFLDAHSLPRPEVNAWLTVAGKAIEVDCLWRDRGVIVELDGRGSHDTAHSFESDRTRDRELAVAGWRVVRITRRQLRDEAGALAADLSVLLGVRRAGLEPATPSLSSWCSPN